MGDRRAVTLAVDGLLWDHWRGCDMGMFLEESDRGFRPRIIRIHLEDASNPQGELSVSPDAWEHPDRDLDALGTLAGSALALTLFLGAKRAGEPLPGLVVAVGSAVRKGLPTASRATVAGISPLTGSYVDSQIGGGLARRLAQIADALVLSGTLNGQKGAILVLDRHGNARIESISDLGALSVPERAAHLKARFPDASGLCVGVRGPKASRSPPSRPSGLRRATPAAVGSGPVGGAGTPGAHRRLPRSGGRRGRARLDREARALRTSSRARDRRHVRTVRCVRRARRLAGEPRTAFGVCGHACEARGVPGVSDRLSSCGRVGRPATPRSLQRNASVGSKVGIELTN